jgi:hypothetical protein
MKKIILITVLNLFVYAGFSQSTFSILNYSLQESWYAKQTGETTELLKKGMENSNCKIVFFQPVKIVTDDVSIYEKYRNDLLHSTSLEIISFTKVQKESGTGWTSFSGLQNIGTKGNAYSIAFYSISDTRQTVFFAIYSASDQSCANELDAIAQSINLTEYTSQSGDKTASQSGNKTRKPNAESDHKPVRKIRIAAKIVKSIG